MEELGEGALPWLNQSCVGVYGSSDSLERIADRGQWRRTPRMRGVGRSRGELKACFLLLRLFAAAEVDYEAQRN